MLMLQKNNFYYEEELDESVYHLLKNKYYYLSFNRSWIPETVEEIIIALLDRGFILTEPFDLPELLRH
jgi:hypothetical protein